MLSSVRQKDACAADQCEQDETPVAPGNVGRRTLPGLDCTGHSGSRKLKGLLLNLALCIDDR